MANGEMSVAQMRKMIEGGNVVSYRGRILRDVRDLPTEADNAVTLDEKISARDQLVAEHSTRQDEIDRLNAEIEAAQADRKRTARSAARRPATPAEDDENDDGDDEPQFAGHPLSHFENLAKGSKDTAEARSRIMSVKGVGEATADQIIAALNDQE